MNFEISDLKTCVFTITGVDISVYNKEFLLNTLTKRMAQVGSADSFEYCLYMKKNQEEAQMLLNALTNMFSQFFRDPMTFAALDTFVLPRLLTNRAKGNELRIWSAGCSTGQEAYSLAMMLSELFEKQDLGFTYRIIATDRSEEALTLARQGVYESETLQNTPLKYFSRYFVKRGDQYHISEDLKRTVSFTLYDLLDPFTSTPPESIFGNFDMVFCCNVLIYYEPKAQERMIRKLEQTIKPEGFLVTGEAEKELIKKKSRFLILAEPISIFKNNKRRVVE